MNDGRHDTPLREHPGFVTQTPEQTIAKVSDEADCLNLPIRNVRCRKRNARAPRATPNDASLFRLSHKTSHRSSA